MKITPIASTAVHYPRRLMPNHALRIESSSISGRCGAGTSACWSTGGLIWCAARENVRIRNLVAAALSDAADW